MPTEHDGHKLKLRYLFTAVFQDGEVIKQTSDDLSKLDPKKSAFHDVLWRTGISPLVKFSLKEVGIPIGAREYSVDLLTGKFSINGAEFEVAEQNFEPTHPLRIVYFRETRVEQDIQVTKTEEGFDRELLRERFYVNKMYIGWQTNWKGNENYQCTIGIDAK